MNSSSAATTETPHEEPTPSPRTAVPVSTPLIRHRVTRFVAIRKQDDISTISTDDVVDRAMPQSQWKLTLPAGRSAYPFGQARVKIAVERVSGQVTGRIHYCTKQKTGSAGQKVQQLLWFASDDRGRSNLLTLIPADISEMSITIYASNADELRPTVVIQEFGTLQNYASKAYHLLRFHVRHPHIIVSKVNKAYLLLRRGGIAAFKEKLLRRSRYPEWIVRHDTITAADRRLMREHIEQMDYTPCVSILMPVYNVPETYLRQAIESVRNQVYTNWQLCIADDNSPNGAVRDVIQEYAQLDSRIKYLFRSENGHISRATNSAAELATGEFLAFLDHDDELREHALYMMVRELQVHRDTDLLFSDEDKITPDGVRHDPYFKSDWNPELLLCHNCVCHFTVVRRDLFERLGGLRSECNGAQDWDLALRVSEATTRERIRHIPHILYHWRVIEGSTAKETAAKPYVTAAQIRAVSEHLERRGDRGAQVESIPELSMLRVRYAVPQPEPLVTLIVPTYNQQKLLEQCVEGILNGTSYRTIDLIVVDNRSDDPKTLQYLQELPSKDSRVRVIRDDGAFNFARINNDAVKHARGSILGFINNDIQVIRPDWLSEMVANLCRKDVAAVGARLLFPNGTVQHAGVITGIGGVAGHQFKTYSVNSLGYFCRAILPQNLSAVTAACMLVHTELFHKVGGFDEQHLAVAFNDIDLCLKLREAGGLIVYTPYAELLHHESVSRGYEDSPEKKARFNREYKAMQDRWGAKLTSDPFYNPNFTLEGVGYDLGVPPRRFGP
jgi:GT2 family glycosyltransferase